MRALVRWTVLSALVAAATALAACGGADGANDLNGAPGGAGDPASGSDPATSSGGTSGGTSGAAADGGGGGGDGGSDADTGAPPVTVDPFAGAAAFVAQTAAGTHKAGMNCLSSCHSHGLTFGGTVVDGAGIGVAGAEVRLLDADGKAVLVHTGPNGNFSSSTPWKAPAYVGVRTASKKVIMATPLKASADGGCNTCHATTGTVSRIHIP